MFRLLAYLFLFLSAVTVNSVYAENWALTLDANVTLNQAAYSKNWTGGEVGSIAWTSNALVAAEKQLHAKLNNRNTLKLAFGQTYSQDRDTDEWTGSLKSTDLIDLETLFRFSLGAFADPYIAGRLESQFYDDSDTDMGRFFNPAEFTESFGAMRILLERDKQLLTTRGGLSFKQRINRDVLDTLTSIRETEIRNYGGVEFVTEFNTPLANGRMAYTTKLIFFKALFFSESDEMVGEEQTFWQHPDMSWENMLTANIIEYLMVNLYLKVLYDKEIDPDLRFKQTLSLGLTYKIQ